MERPAPFVVGLLVGIALAAGNAATCAAYPDTYPDTALAACADTSLLFRAYRFDDDPFTTLRYRDLEFHWDALTDSVLSGDVRTTLDNYAENLVVTRGVNPLGYDMSLIELVYDYFHNSAFPSNYTRNSRDTTAVVFGDSTWGWCQDITPYKPTDWSVPNPRTTGYDRGSGVMG